MCRLVRRALADVDDRRRRPRRGDSRHRADDRRRSHRQGRRHPVVPRVPRRAGRRADRASGDSVVVRVPADGPEGAARRRRSGGDDHPVGRLSDGLQLLHDLGVLRRQGPVRQLLRDAARSCSTSCARSNASSACARFFMMDENFLLYKKRALELLDLHEAPRQGVVAVRLLVGQRDSQVRHAPARRARRERGSGSGSSRPAAGYAKLKGADTIALDARAAVARHPRARVDDHRPGAPHAREHRATRSSTPSRTTPTATSSCSTRRCRARRCTREMEAQGRMLDDVDLADIHGQYKFNFRHAAHRARRLEGVARPGVPARLRGQRAEPVPHDADDVRGLAAVRPGRRRARAGALRRRGGEAARRATARRCGRWRGTCAASNAADQRRASRDLRRADRARARRTLAR